MSEKLTHFGNQLIPEHEKEKKVREVFDSVASKYDLMSDLMSFGVHRIWKRFVVSETGLRPGQSAIDVAGGTADIALLMKDRVGEEGTPDPARRERRAHRARRHRHRGEHRQHCMRFVQGN